MRIAIGANKRGSADRTHVSRLVRELGHEPIEIEIPTGQEADYPEVAAKAAQLLRQGQADRAILVARTGMGMCVVANKFPGIRAAVCYDEFTADISRRYLDVNVLCLSADLLGDQLMARIVETWLHAPFEGGRHAKRLQRIAALEPRGDAAQ